MGWTLLELVEVILLLSGEPDLEFALGLTASDLNILGARPVSKDIALVDSYCLVLSVISQNGLGNDRVHLINNLFLDVLRSGVHGGGLLEHGQV